MHLEAQRTHMLAGQPYNDLTPELVAARAEAVHRTNRYNNSFGQAQADREALLRELMHSVGQGVHFEPNLRCEFGFNISIGDRFYANFDCILLDGGGIEIGDDVLFGPRVGIYTANHALDAAERAAGICLARKVTIGHRVWVGAGVHINPSITIGEGAVIGSGSVVTHNVPAHTLAAGVPCRVLREITAADRLSPPL